VVRRKKTETEERAMIVVGELLKEKEK